MYLRVRLKNELFSRNMLALILLSVIFSISIGIFSRSLTNGSSFNVRIEDEDRSPASAEFIDLVATFAEVRPVEKDEDVAYTIKKGFEENFLKGRLEGLIRVKKAGFKSGISFLNDRIATKLATSYIYRDLYERMRQESDISLNEYKAKLSETELANEIFTLNINDKNLTDKPVKEADYSGYIKLFFIALFGIYINIRIFADVKIMRISGLVNRLGLLGLGEKRLFLSSLVLGSLKFALFLIPILLLTITEIKIYLIAINLFYISGIILYSLCRVIRDEMAFTIISKILWLILIVLALAIKFLY